LASIPQPTLPIISGTFPHPLIEVENAEASENAELQQLQESLLFSQDRPEEGLGRWRSPFIQDG